MVRLEAKLVRPVQRRRERLAQHECRDCGREMASRKIAGWMAMRERGGGCPKDEGAVRLMNRPTGATRMVPWQPWITLSISQIPRMFGGPGAHHAFGGEQGHLRVVGDGTGQAVRRSVVADTVGSKARPDFGERHELHCRAERVAGAKQTAMDTRGGSHESVASCCLMAAMNCSISGFNVGR